MKIGNLNLMGLVFSAPLAGVSNRPFRVLALETGAAMAYTEMVSSEGIIRHQKGGEKIGDQTLCPEGAVFGCSFQFIAGSGDLLQEEQIVFRPRSIEKDRLLSRLPETNGCCRSRTATPCSRDPPLCSWPGRAAGTIYADADRAVSPCRCRAPVIRLEVAGPADR